MERKINWLAIDIPMCSLTYGESPCTAAIGVTGAAKCFNSRRTCQDLPNFDQETNRAFFIDPTETLDMPVGNFYASAGKHSQPLPLIRSVNYTPAQLALGEGLGARAVLNVQFSDTRSPDTNVYEDPYLVDRDYNPRERGTFWGKFMARHWPMVGQWVHWAVLDPTQLSMSDFPTDVRRFIVASIDGPNQNGIVTLVAKDPLSLLDSRRSWAPGANNGRVDTAIDDDDTTLILSPEDVGGEYPSSGHINIGGSEICSFTRSGDTMTITRGQYNTEAVAHDIDEKVQLCLIYSAEDPADIIEDLMTNYAHIDSDLIPLGDWQIQTGEFIARLYSAVIAEPTEVRKLVEELITQCGLAIWWDGQRIRLQVLRDIPSTLTISDDQILADSMVIKRQEAKRVSRVHFFYGLKDPLRDIGDATSYWNQYVTVDAQALHFEEEYGGVESVRAIFSRWVTTANRGAANRVNTLILRRYGFPPRLMQFDILRTSPVPELAQGIELQTVHDQDATGASRAILAQTIGVKQSADRVTVIAEEIVYTDIEDADDPNKKIVIIGENANNLNLRTLFLSVYPDVEENDVIEFYVQSGVVIGSTSKFPALQTGAWPEGAGDSYSIKLVIASGAAIVGRPGAGGSASGTGGGRSGPVGVEANAGGAGGPAFLSEVQIDVENEGLIGGGGGGGGGAAATAGSDRVIAVAGGGAGAGWPSGPGGAAGINPFFNPGPYQLKPGGSTVNKDTPGAGGDAFAVLGLATCLATGGSGGDLGQAGEAGDASATWGGALEAEGGAGAAGLAIIGYSMCTITGGGDIIGGTTG